MNARPDLTLSPPINLDLVEPVYHGQQKDVKTELMRQVLIAPGCCFPVSELTRRRVNRQSITASVANDVTTELQCKGFGSVEKVKIGRTKPVNVFSNVYLRILISVV